MVAVPENALNSEDFLAKVTEDQVREAEAAFQRLAGWLHAMESYEGGRWVPYFARCLFAGIRPDVPNGEITRFKPEHIDLAAGQIHLPAFVSKTNEPRTITIQPNLVTWLQAYPLKENPA